MRQPIAIWTFALVLTATVLGTSGRARVQAAPAAATLGLSPYSGDDSQGISLDQLRLTPPTEPTASWTASSSPATSGRLGLTRVTATFVPSATLTPGQAASEPFPVKWSAVVRIQARVLSALRLAGAGGALWPATKLSVGQSVLQIPKVSAHPTDGVLVAEARPNAPLTWTWRQAGPTLIAPSTTETTDLSALAPTGGIHGSDGSPRRLVLAYEGPLGTILRADYEPAAGAQAPRARLGAEYQARVDLGANTAARVSAAASVGVDLGELAQDGGLRLPTPQTPSVQAGLAYELGDRATLTATYRIDDAGVRLERSAQVGIGLNLSDSASLSASYRLVHFATETGSDQAQAQAEASLKLSF